MDPKNKRSFIALLGIAAIDNFGFAMIFVMFAPLFLSPDYHFFASDTPIATRNFYLTLLFAAYPLTQFFGAPLLGDLADRVGRKKALVVTVTGLTVGFLFSGVACLFYSTPLLIISRLYTGFFAGNMSICLSGIADISPNEKVRSRNFGILTTAWAVSWNLAMIIGGYLSNPSQSKWLSPALPFWVTAGLTLVSLIILTKFYTETHVHNDKHPFNLAKGIRNVIQSLKIKPTRPFFLAIFVWTIGWGLSVQWYGTYSILGFKATQHAISWGLFIMGAFWAFGGSILNPALIKRYKSLAVALIGLSFTTLFLFLAGIPREYFIFNSAYCAAAIFSAFSFSNVMNLASINAPDSVQGKVMGISQSVMSIAWIIVPIFGGIIGSNFIHLTFPISAIFLFLGTLVIFFQWVKKPKKPAKT